MSSLHPVQYQFWDPEGRCAQQDSMAKFPNHLSTTSIEQKLLEGLLNVNRDQRPIRASEVRRCAERLGFINSQGCVPGCFNVLPRGVFFENSIQCFNRRHAMELGAITIEFPIVFDHASDEMQELTKSYEQDGRMFRLGEPDENCRLAYAADPGIFNWLRGRTLDPIRLPLAIISHLPAMRRWKSGELGDLDHLRQYPLSDLHIIVANHHALTSYLENTRLGAEGARFWVDEDWVMFVDIAKNFLDQFPTIGSSIASAAKKWTLIRVYSSMPRYYSMRSGIIVDAGYADVMLYNMQWDEENPRRFQIRSKNEHPVVVLHGNMATGWPLLLPILIGRTLSNLAPRGFPVEVAPVQVCVLPVLDRHVKDAQNWMEKNGHLRATLLGPNHPLGRRLRDVRQSFCPISLILGDRERISGAHLTYSMTNELLCIGDIPDFLKARIARCTPDIGLPVVNWPFDIR